MATAQGTKENPWTLKTPPLSSEYTMHKEVKDNKKCWYVRLGKQFCTMTIVVLLTYMKCLKNMETGWTLAVLMNRNL